MNTVNLDFKVLEKYEVIGQGGMVTTPCQIGQWWVTPAQDYQGKIPADVQQKLFEFLNQGVSVQGFLVAEDMKVIEEKKKQEERKQELTKKALQTGIGVVLNPLIGLGLGVVTLVAMLIAYDPMLIAVLPSGEWICLGTWYD